MDHWVAPFLEQLRHFGQLSKAARATGVSPAVVYARKQADADFAAACDDAIEEAVDEMENEARRRAMHGVEEPLTYQGSITYEVERDEHGNPVIERYDTGSTDKEGHPIMASRHKPKLDAQGRPIPVTIRKPSDALLMFMLKGRRKKVFAERTELTGAEGAPVQIDENTRAARIAQIMAVATARREAEAAESKRQQEQFGDLA